jgi:uncharacterized protein with HEPN domain
MSRNWQQRIQDIQSAIAKIQNYTEQLTFDEFQNQPAIVDAVLYNFTIIGEAARTIPEDIQIRYPEVPWQDMKALRNRMVHEYFRVSYEIIWDTIQYDLDQLIPHLKRIVETESN